MQRPDYRPNYQYETPDVQVAYDWLQELKQTKGLPFSFAPLPEIYDHEFNKVLNHLMTGAVSPPRAVLLAQLRENQENLKKVEKILDEKMVDICIEAPQFASLIAEHDPENELLFPADLANPVNVLVNTSRICYPLYDKLLRTPGAGAATRVYEETVARAATVTAVLLPLKRLVVEMQQENEGIEVFLNEEYIDPTPFVTPSATVPALLDGLGFGDLSGVVKDSSGKPVPDASVIADNGKSTTTDSQGNFHFDGLPSGKYTLLGFSTMPSGGSGSSDKRPSGARMATVTPQGPIKLTHPNVPVELTLWNPGETEKELAKVMDGFNARMGDFFGGIKKSFVAECTVNNPEMNFDLKFKLPDPPLNFQVGNLLGAKLEMDGAFILKELLALTMTLTAEVTEVLTNDILDFLGKSFCDAQMLAAFLALIAQDMTWGDKARRWTDWADGVFKHNFSEKLGKGQLAEKKKQFGQMGEGLVKSFNEAKDQAGALFGNLGNPHFYKSALDQFLQILWNLLQESWDALIGTGGIYLQQLAVNFIGNFLCINMATIRACLENVAKTIERIPTENAKTRIPENWEAMTPAARDAFLAKNFATQEEAEHELKLFAANRSLKKNVEATKNVYQVMMATARREPGQETNVGLSAIPTADRMMTAIQNKFNAMSVELDGFANQMYAGTQVSGEARSHIIAIVRELLFITQVGDILRAVASDASLLQSVAPVKLNVSGENA